MKLREIYARPGLTVSVEFFPPKTPKGEAELSAALELGIDYATQQCEGLLRFGVPGIHFYSLNKSRSVMAISRNLSLSTFA